MTMLRRHAEAAPAALARRRTQAERREEAERRLLDAAIEIVARTGTVRLTLAEVGEAAGYSRGLPAHRFGNKAGLVRALAAHINERFLEQIRAAPAREPGLDTIRGHVSLYFSRGERHWTNTRALLVMMTEGFMGDAQMKADLTEYNRAAMAFLERHIRIGIERGEVCPDADAANTAMMILGAMRGVMLQRLIDEDIALLKFRDRMLGFIDTILALR